MIKYNSKSQRDNKKRERMEYGAMLFCHAMNQLVNKNQEWFT
jgi:hypothetical protein